MSVVAFTGATISSQHIAKSVDAMAYSVSGNSTSSIVRFGEARAHVREVEAILERQIAGGVADPSAVEEQLRAMREVFAQYLSIDPYPGERELWAPAHASLASFEAAVARTSVELKLGRRPSARATLEEELRPAADRLVTSIWRITDFNARAGRALALDIVRRRQLAGALAYGLGGCCVVLSFAVAFIAIRSVRRHELLREEHARLLAVRAHEMEAFAGRVAHDVQGPLATIQLALQSLPAGGDPKVERKVAIAVRGLRRASAVTRDLLSFARAGAIGDPSETTDVALVLPPLVEDLQTSASARDIVLSLRPLPSCRVICSAGLFTSVIENLGSNAIKYMTGSDRRIEIAVELVSDRARFTIADTGPGMDADLCRRVFEPYVRGATNQPGLGLGLATVTRIVEAHHGRVGVESAVGAGSRFWFELPLASAERAEGKRLDPLSA